MRPRKLPSKLVEDYLSILTPKLKSKIRLEELVDGKFSKRSLCVDGGVFIYPTIYDPWGIPGAASARLDEIASGTIGARTSTLTWDEVTWVVRRLFDPKKTAAQGASFLRLPTLKLPKVDF